MSEFHVRAVKLGPISRLPNSDTLCITDVEGYPVVFKENQFKEGDLVSYLPIDSIVPDTAEWAFLNGNRRIRAKKIRGTFSMGMLAPLPKVTPFPDTVTDISQTFWQVGDNLQEALGITKYEPHLKNSGVQGPSRPPAPQHPGMPRYTDIEGLRKYGRTVLVEGEEVVITEKLHGCQARWMWDGELFHVGSHNQMRQLDPGDPWCRVLLECGLGEKLTKIPNYCVYGELIGNVQDLKYGLGSGLGYRVYDILDSRTLEYLDADAVQIVCAGYGIEAVPLLYRGPWSEGLKGLAEGKTHLGAEHIREGFVVKPIKERYDHKCGRVILKLVSESFLMRKENY